MKTSRTAMALGIILMALSTTARAQQLRPVDSFEQLRLVVRQGDTVTVTGKTGTKFSGTILDLSSATLALLTERTRRELQEGDVATISQRRPDSLTNGALWGFGVGAVSGFILSGTGSAIASIGAGPDAGVSAGDVLSGTLIIAGIGTAIGMGLDAVIKRDAVIYAHSTASVAVTIVPLVARERKGIMLVFARQ